MHVVLNLFILIQAAGAIIGAGGSVIGELAYLKAMQDQRIDHAERAHLRLIARALRYGMMLVLLSSLAIVLIDYDFVFPTAFSVSYWLLMTFALIIIFFSWALSHKRVAFWLGSAAVFAGWWALAFLVMGDFPALGYGASLALYIVATGVIAAILSYARMLTKPTS